MIIDEILYSHQPYFKSVQYPGRKTWTSDFIDSLRNYVTPMNDNLSCKYIRTRRANFDGKEQSIVIGCHIQKQSDIPNAELDYQFVLYSAESLEAINALDDKAISAKVLSQEEFNHFYRNMDELKIKHKDGIETDNIPQTDFRDAVIKNMMRLIADCIKVSAYNFNDKFVVNPPAGKDCMEWGRALISQMIRMTPYGLRCRLSFGINTNPEKSKCIVNILPAGTRPFAKCKVFDIEAETEFKEDETVELLAELTSLEPQNIFDDFEQHFEPKDLNINDYLSYMKLRNLNQHIKNINEESEMSVMKEYRELLSSGKLNELLEERCIDLFKTLANTPEKANAAIACLPGFNEIKDFASLKKFIETNSNLLKKLYSRLPEAQSLPLLEKCTDIENADRAKLSNLLKQFSKPEEVADYDITFLDESAIREICARIKKRLSDICSNDIEKSELPGQLDEIWKILRDAYTAFPAEKAKYDDVVYHKLKSYTETESNIADLKKLSSSIEKNARNDFAKYKELTDEVYERIASLECQEFCGKIKELNFPDELSKLRQLLPSAKNGDKRYDDAVSEKITKYIASEDSIENIEDLYNCIEKHGTESLKNSGIKDEIDTRLQALKLENFNHEIEKLNIPNDLVKLWKQLHEAHEEFAEGNCKFDETVYQKLKEFLKSVCDSGNYKEQAVRVKDIEEHLNEISNETYKKELENYIDTINAETARRNKIKDFSSLFEAVEQYNDALCNESDKSKIQADCNLLLEKFNKSSNPANSFSDFINAAELYYKKAYCDLPEKVKFILAYFIENNEMPICVSDKTTLSDLYSELLRLKSLCPSINTWYYKPYLSKKGSKKRQIEKKSCDNIDKYIDKLHSALSGKDKNNETLNALGKEFGIANKVNKKFSVFDVLPAAMLIISSILLAAALILELSRCNSISPQPMPPVTPVPIKISSTSEPYGSFFPPVSQSPVIPEKPNPMHPTRRKLPPFWGSDVDFSYPVPN